MLDNIVRFFQEGGAFMLPIAVVLFTGVAIAIERAIFLFQEKRKVNASLDIIEPILSKRDFHALANLEHPSLMSKVLVSGAKSWQQQQDKDHIESVMHEALIESMPRLEKRTPYLSILANISTLLGLLGTILGLIAAFSAIASANPAEKASLLSQSISVAMNTTAFGLISAIPLLMLHSMLQTKTAELVSHLHVASVKVFNTLTKK
ncbi:MotA/TolQ/ExbB proton channel family protein [Thalassotalea aquiviva]|uniref:MotA/TolQ/ExbB proton channel family protein n=1 Tax=Thalassotalea aquiviva TaxID=3242415 RepID=UPI00352B0C15